jgi:hypothetical protein
VHLSSHARTRMRQRSIPEPVVSVIYDYGQPYHSAGALGFRLDRATLELAEEHLPPTLAKRLARYRGAYIVVAEGEVVKTAAWPTRRRRL